jgi:transmembrane sensor
VAAARELERKSGGSLQLLAAGEKAQVSPRGEITNRESLDVAKATAWRQRRLVFEDSSLADIASRFNQYNVRPKIRVQGSAGSERYFSGTFDADEPISIKHALAGDRTLLIEDLGDEIVIRTREQEETDAQ